MSLNKKLEASMERLMYASRWIMAPVFVGMSFALLLLAIKFFQELFHVLPHILEVGESDLMLTILTLIDLSLVGSLIIMVMFSGYENFVSSMEIGDDTEKLEWLGTHDYGAVKIKVASSIVAISSIHLLKVFMNISAMPNDKLIWYVAIHLTLVVSAVLLGVLERLTKH